MEVTFARISGKALRCSGSRCGMIAKAMPLSAFMALKKSRTASTPPAEAPRPTTGKDCLSLWVVVRRGGASRAGDFEVCESSGRLRAFFLAMAVFRFSHCEPRKGAWGAPESCVERHQLCKHAVTCQPKPHDF